jgi:hypothetical protein
VIKSQNRVYPAVFIGILFYLGQITNPKNGGKIFLESFEFFHNDSECV